MIYGYIKNAFNRLRDFNHVIGKVNDRSLAIEGYEFANNGQIKILLHIPGKNIYPKYKIEAIVNDKSILNQLSKKDLSQLINLCKMNNIRYTKPNYRLKSINIIDGQKIALLEKYNSGNVETISISLTDILQDEFLLCHLSSQEVESIHTLYNC